MQLGQMWPQNVNINPQTLTTAGTGINYLQALPGSASFSATALLSNQGKG